MNQSLTPRFIIGIHAHPAAFVGHRNCYFPGAKMGSNVSVPNTKKCGYCAYPMWTALGYHVCHALCINVQCWLHFEVESKTLSPFTDKVSPTYRWTVCQWTGNCHVGLWLGLGSGSVSDIQLQFCSNLLKNNGFDLVFGLGLLRHWLFLWSKCVPGECTVALMKLESTRMIPCFGHRLDCRPADWMSTLERSRGRGGYGHGTILLVANISKSLFQSQVNSTWLRVFFLSDFLRKCLVWMLSLAVIC